MGVKRTIPTFLMLILLSASTGSRLIAQSAFDSIYYNEAIQIREEVEVFTDRTLYMAGEPVLFRADYRLSGLEGVPWSDVLYLELVAPDGRAVTQAKYPVSDGVSRGGLTIPSDAGSGIYYLKAYTRWMRNRGPAGFTVLPLKIVNPFRAEVIGQVNGHNGSFPKERRLYRKGQLRIDAPGNRFRRSEEVGFRISYLGNGPADELHGCLAVVPLESADTINGPYKGNREDASANGFSLDYLPDIGGASIGGSVVREDGSPEAFTTLHFTLFGNDPGYYVTTSDDRGRFIISTLGSSGNCEVFVAAKPYRDQQVEVRIDQDFDRGEMNLPAGTFSLSEQELDAATQMSVRLQLSRIFGERTEQPQTDVAGNLETVPFYGVPEIRLDLEEFVDLPYLDEVFENLVPMVNIIRRQGGRQFVVENENSTVRMYPPLIMVDYIPVFDQEAVLALASEKIRQIEVIDDVYIRGNVNFGGVISILSRQGDMAGIDLPDGAYFFDFQALALPDNEKLTIPEPGSRTPDTRNTLLWLGDLALRRGDPVEITCMMPDQPGEYMVLVRSVMPDGELQAATFPFIVE